jgi:sulfur-oxidizing protein SoxX
MTAIGGARLCAVMFALGAAACTTPKADPPAAVDAIPVPLAAGTADPANGRKIIAGRDANCLLCHAIPESGERFMGNLAPSLSGIGARLTAGQLRLRVADMSRLNPQTIMPAYFRSSGLHNVAAEYRGRTILSAAQVEDVVAYLQSLQ